MHCKKFLRVTQGVGAHDTFRPVTVASAPDCISVHLAPLTLVRGALPAGATAGPACTQSPVAVRRFRFYAAVIHLVRPVSLAQVRQERREMIQTNRRQRASENDYPYELQLQLFGNHLISLAEEAGRFDFRGTYTPAEVAEILQVAPSTVYDLLHTGELPSVRIGRQFRVGKFSFWAYINGLDREELVEDILERFVTQHCCRDGACVPRGGLR